MTLPSTANWELAIVLPLGAIANQLMKIEMDLRLLNMKALDFAIEGGSARQAGLIETRLDSINHALDSIRGIVSDIGNDVQSRPSHPTRATRKPSPERDD
jgi:hypothetical protein